VTCSNVSIFQSRLESWGFPLEGCGGWPVLQSTGLPVCYSRLVAIMCPAAISPMLYRPAGGISATIYHICFCLSIGLFDAWLDAGNAAHAIAYSMRFHRSSQSPDLYAATLNASCSRRYIESMLVLPLATQASTFATRSAAFTLNAV